MQKLTGAPVAEKIIAKLPKKSPTLFVLMVGKNEASSKYVERKCKKITECGGFCNITSLSETATTKECISQIETANQDKEISGIIVQLPLPAHIDQEQVRNAIVHEKDIDVLSDIARRKYAEGSSTLIPPIVFGIENLLSFYNLTPKGVVVVIGEGPLVGLPIQQWLIKKSIPFICVTKETEENDRIIRSADWIFSGAGSPGLLTSENVKNGAIVIDAGTNASLGTITGDADYISLENVVSAITPVPGGVGPVTVAALIHNLWLAKGR